MTRIDRVLSREEIKKLRKEYGNFFKITADIARGILIVGCELHADGETVLLDEGSNQDDVWGGGIFISEKTVDTTAILNLRPNRGNSSMDILDPVRRKSFIDLVRKLFAVLWET